MFLVGDLAKLVVERLGERREELERKLASPSCHGHVYATYLGLARVALMARNANLVKEAVQLADDGGDLLGEVARVHDGW